MKRTLILVAAVVIVVMIVFTFPLFCQRESLPGEWRSLDQWLDKKLDEWRPPTCRPLMFNAHHILASESMVATTPSEVNDKFLEMLFELDTDTISFYIYPENFDRYKGEYDRLISEVKKHGKRLVIGYMVSSKTFRNTPSFDEYLDKELEYLKLYVERWRPDYVAVFIEPITMQKRVGASYTEEDWVRLARETSKLVKAIDPKVRTVAVLTVGEFMLSDVPYRLAKIGSLDVIGVNIYSWKIDFTKLGRRAERLAKLKEVWIWETWWSTQKGREGKRYEQFRDCALQELNSKWIRAMAYFAQLHNITMISPFFTDQFVYCYKPPYPTQRQALQDLYRAVLEGRRTPTFFSYRDLIREFRG